MYEAKRQAMLTRLLRMEREIRHLRADLEDLAPPSVPEPSGPAPSWDGGPYRERVLAAVGGGGFRGSRADLALAVAGKAVRVRAAVTELFEAGVLAREGERIVRVEG